jgi:sugar O-acyltransferase (sialic acid O-acetyltransferase NeuD family)
MKDSLYGVFGTGGFGREVMPVVQRQIAKRRREETDESFEVVFVESEPSARTVNGYTVVSEKDFISQSCGYKYYNVALGSSISRCEVSKRLRQAGCIPFSVFAETSIVYDTNIIGNGATVCDNVIITSNVVIGVGFQANIYSYVAHDCRIGNYVTLAPRASCNGNVVIEDFAYIGTGATIKQGTQENPIIIGAGATIGMGAVVTKNVAPNTVVIGNPAKLMVR